MIPGKQKIDISSFSKEEKEMFEKYGRVPSSKALLANKLKERKYFDSGDYALSKAGVSPHHSVGTAIPSPADIPHASPPAPTASSAASTSPGAGPAAFPSPPGIAGPGTSPTSSFHHQPTSLLGTSPGKDADRRANLTFAQ